MASFVASRRPTIVKNVAWQPQECRLATTRRTGCSVAI
ncbi:hypothetical protein A2U01_0096695 [Trifolium medium]|uniref:Uncharacterized protein n=1 Tax=Trifolium medium TaxID=97028 RepID=A0A392USF6_9FABA|nr:hypothetical protein [Trifolium medium]